MVITRDGQPLVQPSLLEVANAVGMTSTTPQGEFYDVVIIGGGPAGLGAAVYAASEGLKTVIVERAAAGGQAGQSSRINNYLGFPDGVTGDQLAERARLQAQHFRAELLTARTVVGLETRGPARQVMLDDGSSVLTHAVVLATGVSYRQLDASGAPVGRTRGLLRLLSNPGGVLRRGSRDHRRRRQLRRSGGCLPLRYADKVTMAVRGDSLHKSMSSYLIEQISKISNIEVRLNTTVQSCGGRSVAVRHPC